MSLLDKLQIEYNLSIRFEIVSRIKFKVHKDSHSLECPMIVTIERGYDLPDNIRQYAPSAFHHINQEEGYTTADKVNAYFKDCVMNSKVFYHDDNKIDFSVL